MTRRSPRPIWWTARRSQSAFVRGFIDDALAKSGAVVLPTSQSAFVRGFIDDMRRHFTLQELRESQSAFVRGFIDDASAETTEARSSSWSQSAFVRGFIDDAGRFPHRSRYREVSIRVRARLHR